MGGRDYVIEASGAFRSLNLRYQGKYSYVGRYFLLARRLPNLPPGCEPPPISPSQFPIPLNPMPMLPNSSFTLHTTCDQHPKEKVSRPSPRPHSNLALGHPCPSLPLSHHGARSFCDHSFLHLASSPNSASFSRRSIPRCRRRNRIYSRPHRTKISISILTNYLGLKEPARNHGLVRSQEEGHHQGSAPPRSITW